MVAPFGLRLKGTTTSRVLPIARVLTCQGAMVRVVIPPWDDRERAGCLSVESGVEIVHTHVGWRPLTPARILVDIVQRVEEFHPHAVHLFKPIGYSGAAATWFAGRRRGPRVIIDADDLEGPAGWAGRQRLGPAGHVRGVQERVVLRRAPRVTVASRWLQQYARHLGLSNGRMLYLPNGFEPESLVRGPDSHPGGGPARATDVEPDGTMRLLWYTRFTEANPGRAAALLAPLLVGPEPPRLAILGEEINAGDRDALAAAFVSAGVADHVDWLGYDPATLARFVRRHGQNLVAVYPLDDDAVNRARCPSKIPQLMALRVPVVGEAVGELSCYLAGFETECLASPSDAEGFRSRVRALLSNAETRARLAERLKAAADKWTWEQTAGGLLDWYTRS